MNMKSTWIKRLAAFVVPCASLVLGARQANAQVWLPDVAADLSLENDTPWPLVFTPVSVFAAYSPSPKDEPCQTVPGGGLPGIAPPNYAQVWWRSHGLGSTGGSFTVSAVDATGSQPTSTVIGTLSWSASAGSTNCPLTWQPASPTPFASTPFGAFSSSYNEGANTCQFSVFVYGGPSLPETNLPTTLRAGQAFAFPEQLNSPDGRTTLGFGDYSATQCSLYARNLNSGNGTSFAIGAVMAVMDGDSNFVAYDIHGNEVWSSVTAGYAGGWLQVDSGMISVLRYWTYRGQRYAKTLWRMDVP
jgi:hypothetical protein